MLLRMMIIVQVSFLVKSFQLLVLRDCQAALSISRLGA